MKRNLHAGRQLSSGLSLNILTDDELEEIHYGTLEVLDETGVFVEDEKALDCFEKGGAAVDRDTKRVRIPPHMVEDAIRSAPLRGRPVEYGNYHGGVGRASDGPTPAGISRILPLAACLVPGLPDPTL